MPLWNRNVRSSSSRRIKEIFSGLKALMTLFNTLKLPRRTALLPALMFTPSYWSISHLWLTRSQGQYHARHLGHFWDNACNRTGNNYFLIKASCFQCTHANRFQWDGKVRYFSLANIFHRFFPCMAREFFSFHNHKALRAGKATRSFIRQVLLKAASFPRYTNTCLPR